MVIAYHLVWTAYGLWLPNDPRGSMSRTIMADHVHLLIRKHRDLAEDMINKCQVASCRAVRDLERRDRFHPVWGGCGWKVFLDSVQDVRRTVKYVEDNPIKGRLPAQNWDFVSPYDDWPFQKRRG